jgi:cytochrome P450
MNALTKSEAQGLADSVPLSEIDLSDTSLYQNDSVWPYLARLRRDDPIHYKEGGIQGNFWSVTRYKDIVAVDTNHQVFSSESSLGGITIVDAPTQMRRPSFISMDPPKHDEQRKAVSPIVAPGNLSKLEATIRSRAIAILDSLPIGETFDWVDKVSIELTTQMLATLFDFPFEDRRLLTYWSDTATTTPQDGNAEAWARRDAILQECLAYFTRLWNERVNASPGSDLISMMAHNPETRNMTPQEFMGNLVLLIVGGNDTTRNSMTGGLLALHNNPAEWDKLRNNPSLIDNMVSEIIRWQTPLAHMRRTALQDTELGGKHIKKGDKVVMWYLSGNRDEEAIPHASQFLIDRPRARQHLSFGFGIHRCVGARVAELQLTTLISEMQKRRLRVNVLAEPVRVPASFVHGYKSMQVELTKY